MWATREIERIEQIRSVLGSKATESDIFRALYLAGNDVDSAINIMLDTPGFLRQAVIVKRTTPAAGTRISTDLKREPTKISAPLKPNPAIPIAVKRDLPEISTQLKQESPEADPLDDLGSRVRVKCEAFPVSGVCSGDPELLCKEMDLGFCGSIDSVKKSNIGFHLDSENKVSPGEIFDEKLFQSSTFELCSRNSNKDENKQLIPINFCDQTRTQSSPCLIPRPVSYVVPVRPASRFESSETTTNRGNQALSIAVPVEKGEFLVEPDLLLVGRTPVSGLSTCRGKILEYNEIVHFTFPATDVKKKYNRQWVRAKTAIASSEIVRFSTKRFGEIGRLPSEWTRCLIPLVNSSKVKVCGRFSGNPQELGLMSEILLNISLYIHSSVFTASNKASWKLVAPSLSDSTVHPLPTLFKLLKIKPFKKADFTPEELDTRKCSLNLNENSDDSLTALPLAKRRKENHTHSGDNNKEQVLADSDLSTLVGTADTYNLEEKDPPRTLMCDLRPYQKQALYWMSELEKGIDVEQAVKTLHPCWDAYRIHDKRASAVYVNVFSGEATTHFPSAMQMARGGILADAMGLGKTVMTIALILGTPGRGSFDNQKLAEAEIETKETKKNKKSSKPQTPRCIKGGTLIVCPMTLLGQWKSELEAHSQPGALSVFVHYGGDRTKDPKVISEHDVVLTTYGVVASAYKSDSDESIFHKVEWFRVVLDEAHTIKSSRSQAAQATFSLASHCRWCLTGTPLQNNLEDLYSLLCFLHVEPWCNWAWWYKLIQKPYEGGDERGLKLVKAILRSLMLRRTKDSTDRQGRPILVLPPADVQIVECVQSEAERDFYTALFKKSKVKFDQFVAQGKVLHNYASILEILLRLRQCCNHPFLVMTRCDTEQYLDLNKLAKRFFAGNSSNPSDQIPPRAFVEEVVEEIRRGEIGECPICLESPDDAVLTPCAHHACRECMLSSWPRPSGGLCPICRKPVSKQDLITCPTENRFWIDIETNWKESSKVSALVAHLEILQQLDSGEKSIVFSQWTSFLDLLQVPLKMKGIGFLRFDGKLGQRQREKVLKEFSETEDRQV